MSDAVEQYFSTFYFHTSCCSDHKVQIGCWVLFLLSTPCLFHWDCPLLVASSQVIFLHFLFSHSCWSHHKVHLYLSYLYLFSIFTPPAGPIKYIYMYYIYIYFIFSHQLLTIKYIFQTKQQFSCVSQIVGIFFDKTSLITSLIKHLTFQLLSDWHFNFGCWILYFGNENGIWLFLIDKTF